MENKNGVLTRPSVRPRQSVQPIPIVQMKNSKRAVFLTGLLVVLLLVSYVYTIKTYEPVKNIIITGGIFVYPFTFLIVAYITKYYGPKEATKSVFMSAGLLSIFLLLMCALLIPTSNNATASYNAVIQYLYANDFLMVGELRIFYPPIGQFLGLLVAYITSHLLYIAVYNAIYRYTVNYLAMGLSVFIAAIIDRIIFMPLFLLENLLKGSNTFDYFIKCLTSEFMATILCVMITIVVYSITTAIKDRDKRELTN